MSSRELCLLALEGGCRAAGDCPRFHAGDRAAALRERGSKKTARVCAYHLRGACSWGGSCRSLHVLPAGGGGAPAARRPAAEKQPHRPVPRAVRLASQVRGKTKRFGELTTRLAQAAGPGGGCPRRALDAECQKKAFEVELELMVDRLEAAIQLYSRGAPPDSDQGDAPPALVVTHPWCDPDEWARRSVLC